MSLLPKVKVGQVWDVLGKIVTIQRLEMSTNKFWLAMFVYDGVEAYFMLNNDWTPLTNWVLLQDVVDE